MVFSDASCGLQDVSEYFGSYKKIFRKFYDVFMRRGVFGATEVSESLKGIFRGNQGPSRGILVLSESFRRNFKVFEIGFNVFQGVSGDFKWVPGNFKEGSLGFKRSF